MNIILALLFLLLPSVALGQPFQGFGSQTPGGAGGDVFVVDTLADSGPGSLREALAGGSRTILFSVAGTILTKKDLVVLHPFVTIDGSTAPGIGITISGEGGLVVHGTPRYHAGADAHDVIITNLRVRTVKSDAIGIGWGAYNVVVDHVSADGSGDGTIDITHGAHDVTVSWSIFGTKDGKLSLIKTMFLPGGPEGVPAETNHITFHHNILTSVVGVKRSERNPRIGSLKDGSYLATAITADFRNNIVANWEQGHGTDVECGAKANLVNNLYTSPLSSPEDQAQAIELRPEGYNCFNFGNNIYGGYAYVAGNLNADSSSVKVYGPNLNSNPALAQANPYPAAPVGTDETCEAVGKVLDDAGCSVGGLDKTDTNYLALIRVPEVCGGINPPPPPPPPGGEFMKGDTVRMTVGTTVYQRSFETSKVVGHQPAGATATLRRGPRKSPPWWQVRFSSGMVGWVSQGVFAPK